MGKKISPAGRAEDIFEITNLRLEARALAISSYTLQNYVLKIDIRICSALPKN